LASHHQQHQKLEIFTRSWHLNNISTKLEIFSTRLASQQHQHEAGISTTSQRSWKSSALGWNHNNISAKLEIFSTRLASQQHQHEAGNLQHKAGIITTLARSWKSSARGWHQHLMVL
jgi:hypothetical protein